MERHVTLERTSTGNSYFTFTTKSGKGKIVCPTRSSIHRFGRLSAKMRQEGKEVLREHSSSTHGAFKMTSTHAVYLV